MAGTALRPQRTQSGCSPGAARATRRAWPRGAPPHGPARQQGSCRHPARHDRAVARRSAGTGGPVGDLVPSLGWRELAGHVSELLPEGPFRDETLDLAFRGCGVGTTLGTYARHEQPFFQREYGYVAGQLPVSQAAFKRTITLPLYPQMSEADLDLIADGLRRVVAAQRG